MTSPEKSSSSWFTNPFAAFSKILPPTQVPPKTEEEKDASLFGLLAILAIARHQLYYKDTKKVKTFDDIKEKVKDFDDVNVKYIISDFKLEAQKIEDYQVVGKSVRSWVRKGQTDGDVFGRLRTKIPEFVSWYLLDNPDPEMKKDVLKLLKYTKKGLLLNAAHKDYIGTPIESVIRANMDTIDFAITGKWPYPKSEPSTFGAKARDLLTGHELSVIMNIFTLALRGDLKKESAISQIEDKISAIQTAWKNLKIENDRTSVSMPQQPTRRLSEGEGKKSPPPETTDKDTTTSSSGIEEKSQVKDSEDDSSSPNPSPAATEQIKIEPTKTEEKVALTTSTEEKKAMSSKSGRGRKGNRVENE
jgi:hypothetical protein